MINKLKRKLILTNMLMVSIVLISAFSAMLLITKNNLEERSIAAMRSISDYYNREILSMPADQIINYSEYGYLKAFTIETNTRTGLITINGYQATDGEFSESDMQHIKMLISKAFGSDDTTGVIKSENLRYYISTTQHGHRIVYISKDYEDTTLRDLSAVLFAAGVITLALVLAISVLFASVSAQPVEKSIRQQKQLIADVSHELKTPITVISANADIIAAHPDSTVSEQMKWIEYIKDETTRMTSLISNMLYLAKRDEGSATEDMTQISLSDTVYEAALPFESVCFETGKQLDLDIAADVQVKGNETSLKQLVAILVDNACKYSDENGLIKVSLTATQDKAELLINNSGEPIPEQSLPHIFDRFYRVDKSRARLEGGYGLGLSIAKSIADSHHAKLNVTSTKASGTTFTCVFKRIKQSK